jgi:hypothetical protein
MVQSNNLGRFKIASLSREGVAPLEGLRCLEGLLAGQLFLGPKAAAWIVFLNRSTSTDFSRESGPHSSRSSGQPRV